ncbi:MAG: hypothetical protein U0163_08620 [Gemmatimonadaceae bacterium]
MTLLEAVVALVILATTAVGFLDVFRADAHAARAASEWTHAAALGESAMEAALAGDAAAAPASGDVVQVQRSAWRGRLDEVTVAVHMSDGRTLQLHRLVRRTR